MNATIARAAQDEWPELPLAAWRDTYATLHMWSQIVGKVRLALSPRINHWWEVPLYVSVTGLTTSAIPYPGGIFEIEFDFIHHQLLIKTNHDMAAKLALKQRSVADFYREFMAALASLGIAVKIWKMPVEIPNPIAFDEDTQHAGIRPSFLGDFSKQREDFRRVSRAVYWESESDTFFLGQLRFGGHAIFRTEGAGASWS
jgi:hypothetical protein